MCERLGVTLIHARPGDAPARGKMERFWRTLRQGCLDHLGAMTQLHDVQARLLAFLDEHYLRAPHGGLFGKLPADVWATATTRPIDEPTLATALTTRTRRRIRRDGTLDVEGTPWQLDKSFLAGVLVTVAIDKTGCAPPVVEHDGHPYVLRAVDAVVAGKTRRKPREAPREPTTPFDPAGNAKWQRDAIVGLDKSHKRCNCTGVGLKLRSRPREVVHVAPGRAAGIFVHPEDVDRIDGTRAAPGR